jgi:hypothetical protein
MGNQAPSVQIEGGLVNHVRALVVRKLGDAQTSQFKQGRRTDEVTAHLIARKTLLISENNRHAGCSQMGRRCRTCRAGTCNDHVAIASGRNF